MTAASDPNDPTRNPVDDRLAALEEALSSPLGQAWMRGNRQPSLQGPMPMPGIIAPLPRRKMRDSSPARSFPPMAKTVAFEAGITRTVWRLMIWLWGTARFLLGNLKDSVLGKRSTERSAVRLRHVMESMGPTFIKLGQQLSIRADILPYAYCRELSKMLDNVGPFPTEQAIAAIERVTKRKVTEVFSVFDPKPIGSGSIACVYQAILKNGEKVAVKVRRPGIGAAFASDLRALDWLMTVAELLAVLRQGMTRGLRRELGTMLAEELNFRLEARYTELFLQSVEKTNQTFMGAPKVYFDLSGEDVLVTEFISGVFVKEILEAVDRKDEKALDALRAVGIHLPTIAARMMRAFYYCSAESILFHADPHPANIIVRRDNSLVFIDFGSCGRLSGRVLRHYEQVWANFNADDVDAMAANATAVLEPLPPINTYRLQKEVEALAGDWLLAGRSEHANWWERCTGQMWMRFIAISRQFNIPMNLDTLRMFRATFLYDSMAMRLWNDLDMTGEYMSYAKERGRRARERISKAVKRRFTKGPTNLDYVSLDNATNFTNQLINRIQNFVDTPAAQFSEVLGKAAFSISITLRVLVIGGTLHILTIFSIALYSRMHGGTLTDEEILRRLLSHPIYQVIAGLIAIVLVRRVLLRLGDVDVQGRSVN